MIGRQYSDLLLQEDAKRWPFSVKAAPGNKPMIEGESALLSPPCFSVVLLKPCASTFDLHGIKTLLQHLHAAHAAHKQSCTSIRGGRAAVDLADWVL